MYFYRGAFYLSDINAVKTGTRTLEIEILPFNSKSMTHKLVYFTIILSSAMLSMLLLHLVTIFTIFFFNSYNLILN